MGNGTRFHPQRIFDSYIQKLYNLKLTAEKEGNQESRYLAKLHLNSLYGFFGKSLEQFQIKITDKVEGSSKDFINIGDNYLLKILSTQPSKSANVAIAAAVTSYARIHLTFRWSINLYTNIMIIFIMWIQIPYS